MASHAMQRNLRRDSCSAGDSALGRGEPALSDLMEDPITHRMMASDGVERDQLVKLIGEARARLARRRD